MSKLFQHSISYGINLYICVILSTTILKETIIMKLNGRIYNKIFSVCLSDTWKTCIHRVISFKIIHVHHDLRKMFILDWNDQQSFYLHHFHIIILSILFCVCQISIHCFIIELQYNHVLIIINLRILNIKLYTILSSSHHIFKVIMNVNRLSWNWLLYSSKYKSYSTIEGNNYCRWHCLSVCLSYEVGGRLLQCLLTVQLQSWDKVDKLRFSEWFELLNPTES